MMRRRRRCAGTVRVSQEREADQKMGKRGTSRGGAAARDGERGMAHGHAPSTTPDGERGTTRDGKPGAPETPTESGGGSWLAAGKRSLQKFQADALTDRAATLTYYGVLAIFPGLLFLVSLLGLLGQRVTQPLIDNLTTAMPLEVRQTLLSAIIHLQRGHAAASLIAIVGMAAALWSSSSYTAAFMRASNVIYGVPEGRPIWKTLPIRLGVTLVLMVLLVASVLIVVLTGGLAGRVGHVLGIGGAAVTAWDIAKWPVLLVLISLMLALLYWASPNAKHGFRWISPGGLLAVFGWLLASALFTVFVANFGHYNKIYGSLATVIIFFVWLWISNIAVLLGAEFNAELERGRAMAAGAPADKEPFVELRDTRKLRGKAGPKRQA
jgi:membrane protein